MTEEFNCCKTCILSYIPVKLRSFFLQGTNAFCLPNSHMLPLLLHNKVIVDSNLIHSYFYLFIYLMSKSYGTVSVATDVKRGILPKF